MLKRLFSAALLAVTVTATTLAVPAYPGKHTVTQPDGTTVTIKMVGDERFHTMITADDNLPVGRANDGTLTYRLADGTLSDIAAHNPGERTAAEAMFLKQNIDNLSVSKLAANLRKANPSRYANHRKQAAKPAQDSRAGAAKTPLSATFTDCPTLGTRKIPVVFVQYSDVKFKSTDPLETFKAYFNEGDQSGRQYFYDQSNGAYDPQFDLYGPVTLSQNRKYYGGNDPLYDNDMRPGQMVAEACQLLDGQINFKDYDTNGDGYVDAVIVLYAGIGEQYSIGGSLAYTIWPHQWNLESSDYGRALTLDGVKISTYGCFNELFGSDASTKIDGIGVFCHEFSHALGLPDLYGTTAASQYYYGMGSWSLMCSGCYNNNGYSPVAYDAYEKWFMGWIDIPEATENTHYTLPVFNSKNAANDQALKITNPLNANEYWVLENRGLEGWDSYNATDGLFIYRVSYDETVWYYNEVNNTVPGRVWPICADNSPSDEDEEGDLWPYRNNNALTATSKPAMKPFSGAAIDRPVTEIKRNSDGTISFWFMKAYVPALDAPVLAAHTDVSATSFTANWSHTSNIEVTYTLEVFPHSEYTLVFDQDLSEGPDQWSRDGYTIQESDGTFRLGSSSRLGSLTSPEFTLDNTGKVTVIYSAKYYGTDNSSIKISLLSDDDTEIASETQQLTGDLQTYTTILEGTPEATVKVQLSTIANKKRVYLGFVKVYTGDASAAQAPAKAPVETGDANTRTITGITGHSYTVENLTENEQYDYRVKAVPADPTEASESKWSATASITLTQSGVETIDTDFRDENAPVRWFNIQGIEVSGHDLTPGIYIRRQGNSSEKIVVR